VGTGVGVDVGVKDSDCNCAIVEEYDDGIVEEEVGVSWFE
jgi:hypothetical protein